MASQELEGPTVPIEKFPDDYSDSFGYPGVEDYSLREFELLEASIGTAFLILGYDWKHPRIVGFLWNVERRIRRPVRSKRQLPWRFYLLLGQYLRLEVGEKLMSDRLQANPQLRFYQDCSAQLAQLRQAKLKQAGDKNEPK